MRRPWRPLFVLGSASWHSCSGYTIALSGASIAANNDCCRQRTFNAGIGLDSKAFGLTTLNLRNLEGGAISLEFTRKFAGAYAMLEGGAAHPDTVWPLAPGHTFSELVFAGDAMKSLVLS